MRYKNPCYILGVIVVIFVISYIFIKLFNIF